MADSLIGANRDPWFLLLSSHSRAENQDGKVVLSRAAHLMETGSKLCGRGRERRERIHPSRIHLSVTYFLQPGSARVSVTSQNSAAS